MRGARAMTIVRALALGGTAALAAATAAAGCRATAEMPPDLAVDDLGVGGDDLAGADLAFSPDLFTCAVGPEICGNGCDDDRNGYADDDDPACTTQLLVTFQTGSPALWRLILEPTPHTVVLDGNPVNAGGMAEHNRLFSPSAYLAFDGSTKLLRRLVLDGGVDDNASVGYTTRDVCVFNGELIVVQPGNPTSTLHRFMPDARTEIGTVSVAGTAAACASDGNSLFVSTSTLGNPSQIVVFDKSANGPVATALTLPIPDALVNDGYARLVDFAYVKKGGLFIGLFAADVSASDNQLNGDVMAPFALDGGSGPYIDGGTWHGVGEFLP